MVAACGNPSNILQSGFLSGTIGAEANEENEREYFAIRKCSIDIATSQNQGIHVKSGRQQSHLIYSSEIVLV